MGNCAGNPPATVVIQFKNGSKEEVVVQNVPADVEVKKKSGITTEDPDPDAPNGGCCNIGYDIKFSYKVCSKALFAPNMCAGEVVTKQGKGTIPGKILGFKIGQYLGTDNSIRYTRVGCDGKEETANLLNVGSSSKLVGYSIQTITRADGKPDICDPPDPDEGKCEITVRSASGAIVYQKTADCPIKHKIRCGNECAEGEIRCESQHHPGYCCHDCKDLARALR